MSFSFKSGVDIVHTVQFIPQVLHIKAIVVLLFAGKPYHN